MTLILVPLAAFAIWEYVLDLGLRLPVALQPWVVGALAYGLTWLPTVALVPSAAVGAVIILHTQVRREPDEPTIVRRGVGRRVPDLP